MTVGSPDAEIVQAAQVESADHHDKLFLATLAHARDGYGTHRSRDFLAFCLRSGANHVSGLFARYT
jgi:hypothetical protein